jgi:hypothetical protein
MVVVGRGIPDAPQTYHLFLLGALRFTPIWIFTRRVRDAAPYEFLNIF